jgi:LPXTG-motif cell wall-anchored protein
MLELYGIENLDELSELEKIKLFKKLGRKFEKGVIRKVVKKFAPEETPEQVPPEQAPSMPEETTSKPIYLIAGIGLIGVLFLMMMKKKKSVAEIEDYSCGCGL